jgi:prephenate dehydrogenase
MSVAILGHGRFGAALAQLVGEAGIAVRAHDPLAEVPADVRAESVRDLVTGARFVVVAVPVPRIRAAVLDLRPHLERDQIVLDVGSVKVGPMAALEEVLGDAIPWVGTHPLFGPLSLALAERPLRVVVCPSKRHPEAAARVHELYERVGCEVVEQTAEGHDRVMAHTHALTFFVAKGMIDAGAGMEVPFAPPSFQAMARAIETVRSDAGHLFTAIAHENPFAGEARKQLVTSLSAIDRALDSRAAAAAAAAEGGGPRIDASPDSTGRFAIPDLGDRSPELKPGARAHRLARPRDRAAARAADAALAARGARKGAPRRAGARCEPRGGGRRGAPDVGGRAQARRRRCHRSVSSDHDDVATGATLTPSAFVVCFGS